MSGRLPILLGALLVIGPALSLAGPAASAEQFADQGKAQLPIQRVVMFSAGVAFFEHRGEVEGDATVDLRFNTRDINDLLKSMVLQDLGGGQISTIAYGSKDPITRTLQTFAIDLTNNPSLAELLKQIRGEKIEIEAPDLVVGTIVGVEQRERPIGEDQVIEVPYLVVLTEDGLRSVSLESAGRVKLANPELDAELRKALGVLAMSNSTDKKTVTLNFTGDGQRPVRVGYIQEAPVWKTSYRLVMREDEQPLLQGWAIIENTTESDWENVQLTLVSGAPISFVMDLYEPLYVDRPVVQPELYGSLRPRTYDQTLGKVVASDDDSGAPEEERLERRLMERRGVASGFAYGMGGVAAAPEPQAGARYNKPGENFDVYFNPAQGVSPAAEAGRVGQLFQYTIEVPVTVKRGQSAMLPIINGEIGGQKLSIYNQAVHAKHPLNGFRLENTSELHLMQGPVTVFDEGAYAGDARLADVQPGNERLISYALDLDVEVAPTMKGQPEQLVDVRIAKGTLHVTHKHGRLQEYLVKNSGKEETAVLLEYPIEQGWELVQPEEPSERTRDLYRFVVDVEPGETETLKIQQERVVNQVLEITNLPDEQIRIFLAARSVSDQVKEALKEVVQRKAAIEEVARNRQQYQQRIDAITTEQERIRGNMSQLPRDSELYRRYVTKFSDQEDEIEELRRQLLEAEQQESALRRALDEYLQNLSL